MPVVRIEDRLNKIVEDTLTEVCPPDLTVHFTLWMSDDLVRHEDAEDHDCGDGHLEEFVNLLILAETKVPGHEHDECRLKSALLIPLRSTWGEDYLPQLVREAWSELAFADHAARMKDLDDELNALVEDTGA